MKIKNIYITLLTLLALTTACGSDELDRIETDKPSTEEGQAVLMISATTGSGLETKSKDLQSKDSPDKDNKYDNLLVFVFDANNSFLGKASSEELSEAKAAKVAGVLYTQSFNAPLGEWNDEGKDGNEKGQDKIAKDIENISPNDVIVGGINVTENGSTSVRVLLVANPTKEIEALYEKDNPVTWDELSVLTVDLKGQQAMYEAKKGDNSIGHSTAVQYITLSGLKKGINYLGKNKYAHANQGGQTDDKRDWWHAVYEEQIPLYRLISEVKLTNIECLDNSNFILQKAYLQEGEFVDQCNAVPNEAIAPTEDARFLTWCKRISFSRYSSNLSESIYKNLNKEGPVVSSTWKGILITHASAAEVYKNSLGTYLLEEYLDFESVTRPLYAFESSNENTVNLVVEGFYKSGENISPDDIAKKGIPVIYRIPVGITSNDGKRIFRRNHIYNVNLKIYGSGNSNLTTSATITVQSMTDVNLDFEFGDEPTSDEQ